MRLSIETGKIHWIFLLVFALLPLLPACRTVPYTDRKQFLLTSVSEENRMGEQAWRDIRNKYPVSRNQSYNKALKRVGTQIAMAVNQSGYYWEFAVFESSEPNAFALPGGKVGVFSAMFKYFENDAELATVVAHEIGHAIARHGGERISQEYLKQAGVAVLSESLAGGKNLRLWMLAYGGIADVGVILPYSREHEYEADRLGMIFMSKAGYTPHAALAFWKKFGQLSETGEIGEFFSTHPMSEKRLRRMEQFLPEAVKYYRSSPDRKEFGEKYE